MKTTALKILLLEDNPVDADLIRAFLEDTEEAVYDLTTAERLSSALNLLEEEPFDLVLSDLNLPDSQGLKILQKLRDKAPQTPVVVMTGLSDNETAQKALSIGAQDYLAKGSIESESLHRAIQRSTHRK